MPEQDPSKLSTPRLIAAVGFANTNPTALRSLVNALPKGTGMGFVLAPHEPIEDATELAATLANDSSLPVHITHDSTVITADTVYLSANAMRLIVTEGVLQAATDSDELPVDALFQSLAEKQGNAAIGIVLDGVDSVRGLKAIAAVGGLTMAQDSFAKQLESGAYGNLATGDIDFLLPPEQMPAELIGYANHWIKGDNRDSQKEQITQNLQTICDLLYEETQHDFKHYRTPMLVRRIQHRLQVLRIESIEQYVERLREDPAERRTLFRKLLVDVSAFFRDPQTFRTLAEQALPGLLKKDPTQEQLLRIWVPGCATGEEAYTLAILLKEQMADLHDPPGVQIFATDVKESALETARAGRYPESITENIEAERLHRFFNKEGDEYQVKQDIRELCFFSNHNLIKDPPLTDIDFISCRNLLIYLGPHLQKKLFSVFHTALRPGGYLLLGPAENVSTHKELFDIVSARYRLCRRKETALNGQTSQHKTERHASQKGQPTAPAFNTDELEKLTQRILLDEFAPKYAIIDDTGNTQVLSPNVTKYLEPPTGRFTGSLLRMARQGLRAGLRATFDEAKKVRRRVINDTLSVTTEQGLQRVMVTVQPMPDLGEEKPLHMVVFQDMGLPLKQEESAPDNQPSLAVAQLEDELNRTRVDLDETVQNLEKVNEELKTANEELLTMNEELRSLNAALEAAKEEVEAGSESLTKINSDLRNLLGSSQIATLFLDESLIIQFFTPAMTELYNLIPSDVGRSLSDITHRFRISQPLPDPGAVTDHKMPIQHELQTTEDRWFMRRVLPYLTPEGLHQGIVVTFTEITALRASEERAQRHSLELETLYHTAPIGLALFDNELRYRRINERLAEINGLAVNQHMGRTLQDVLPDLAPHVVPLIEKVFSTGEPVSDIEVVGHTRRPSDQDQVWLTSFHPLKKTDGSVEAVSTVVFEITERKQIEESLREASRYKDDYVAMLAHELRNPLAPLRNAAQVLRILDLPDPRLKELRGIIDRQVEHMAHMLDDLLDVSRLARGKMQIEHEKLDLAELVRQVAADFTSEIDAQGLSLQLNLPDEPWWAVGDVTRLIQLVNNLLRNAVKFTPSGGRITVSMSQAEDGNEAIITILDSGIGMDPDMVQRAFEPFWQAEGSNRSRGGLGLGLALVKGITELHGGAVWASSPGPDSGSEFWVRLPLLNRVSSQLELMPTTDPTRQSLRILVIDDLQDTADTLKLLLEHEGHEVVVAYSGNEGIVAALEAMPDVVLCDIGLPGEMDGYAVARTFRDDPNLRKTYLIAVTGYGRDKDREEANQAGFDEHLLKPVSLDDLYSALARRR